MVYRHLFHGILTCFALSAATSDAASITWVAQTPNNDMNSPVNWSPSTIPGSGDVAIFDNLIPGIATNPTESSTSFSVDSFNFPHAASPFHFSFNNQTLTFYGTGLTGSQTNASIQIANINNSSFPGSLISFLGSLGHSGSSNIAVSNSATLTGSQSNTSMGAFDSLFHSSGPFTIADGGTITVTNGGDDSATGNGNNVTANSASSELRFDQSFTAGNNVAISAINSGTFSGANASQGDSVAIINGSQFFSAGAFQAGDNFSCDLRNTGDNSSTGVGGNHIGQLNAAQMFLQSTGLVGDNCTIQLTNIGNNSSQTTSTDFIAYLNDEQFFAASPFQAGNNFNLTANNSGNDSSTGFGGAQVAAINSNSGDTGNQVVFAQGAAFEDGANMRAVNNGTYSGSNTNGGSSVALMNLGQIAIGNSNSPGSYAFIAGNDLHLSASSNGVDSAQGTGGDAVGVVSVDQIAIFTTTAIGNRAQIIIDKSGVFSGTTSASYLNVGSSGACQLNCGGIFEAGDDFNLEIGNFGTHSGSGVGNDFIGTIGGQQASFQQGISLGNNASIFIRNEGNNFSNSNNGNQVAALINYGKQILVNELFQAGDHLSMIVMNSGLDKSTGAGGGYTGFINNNSADQTASQAHLNGGALIGDSASIALTNLGIYQGSNTSSGGQTAVLAGQQLMSAASFRAGNQFTLTASNTGLSEASGQSGHSIGLIGNGGQIEFSGTCNVGQDATITLINIGTNKDATGTGNLIGYIGGSQIKFDDSFQAGQNLKLSATNTSINAGDSSNLVGHVDGSQLFFAQNCNLEDRSTISAANDGGTITDSQITFNQGFNILNGKAIIQAANSGTLGSFGINIQGNNAGGNANIQLTNSSLNIETSLPSFTIGELNGDSTSLAQSLPTLVINTDPLVQAEFSGVIQNFLSNASELAKTGPGLQKLSGNNTYTGLTTVQDGTLVINGTVAGNVLVNPHGILKGNGTIGASLINRGVVSPGESIGTLTVQGNYTNARGTYAVEINGKGESDLINVSEEAILNGGTVLASSSDGTFLFQQPYTIVTAAGGVTGTYSQATSFAFIKPVLAYDPNNVYLIIQSDLLSAADSCNQVGTARALDSIINPSSRQSLLISAIANLQLEEAQDALESLSGFQYTSDVGMTNISTRRFLRRLYDPLRSIVNFCECSPCTDWTGWIEMSSGFTRMKGKNTHQLRANSYEVTRGIQKTFCHNITCGFSGSYEYDHINHHHGKANRNSEFLALYGLYRPSLFYALADLTYGHSSNNISRAISAGNIEYKAHSNPTTNLFAFYGEVGVDFKTPGLLIQPFVGIQAGKAKRNHIRESNSSGFGLALKKHEWDTTSSRLGLHISTCALCDYINASLDIAWNQLLTSDRNSTTAHFREFEDSFQVCGDRFDRPSFDYALTFAACPYEGITGYFEFDGEWWQHANTFNILGGIEVSW